MLGKAWKTEPSSFRFTVPAIFTITAAAVVAEQISQKVNDLDHTHDYAANEDEQSKDEGQQQENLFKCHSSHLIL